MLTVCLHCTSPTCRKLEEQEKSASNVDTEGTEDQADESCDTDKVEEKQDEAKPDANKKSSVSRGETKTSYASQDTTKKADGKKQGAAPNKDPMSHVIPDLQEEELWRDSAMITVSMGIAVTGAKVKGVSLYQHLARVCGREVS